MMTLMTDEQIIEAPAVELRATPNPQALARARAHYNAAEEWLATTKDYSPDVRTGALIAIAHAVLAGLDLEG